MRFVIALSIIGFLLAGCSSAAPIDVPPQIPVASSATETFSYVSFRDKQPKANQPALLFFMKEGDPFSAMTDEAIREAYGAGGAILSTYKLDVARDTGALLTYIVFFEDTVVLLGQDGARKGSLLHPSKDAIKMLVTRGRFPQ